MKKTNKQTNLNNFKSANSRSFKVFKNTVSCCNDLVIGSGNYSTLTGDLSILKRVIRPLAKLKFQHSGNLLRAFKLVAT